MARPGKSLEQHVRDGSFRARRHHLLLDGDSLHWKPLAELQEAYQFADHELERHRVARQFENAAKHVLSGRRRAQKPLREVLEKLGPAGSAEQAIRFFPWAFRHAQGSKAGKRFRLEAFQEDFFRDWFARDRRGGRIYTRGLFGGPKGTGKTPLLTGLGCLDLVSRTDRPQVYALAGSREQAGSDPEDFSRMHALARNWASDGAYGEYVRAGSTIRCPGTRGMFKILTSDGRLAQGAIPSLGLLEEFWLFQHKREREAVNALARALHKRGEGQACLLAGTTSGFDKQTPLGEMYDGAFKLPNAEIEVLRDGCLTIVRDPDSGFLMHWYAVPADGDIEDPKLLRAANPLSTVSTRDLLRDLRAPGTDELDWRRLCANQWTAVREAWLPMGLWPRLAEERLEIPVGADVSVAVDAAYSWDTTAVVVAWRRPEDGRVVLQAHVWTLRDDAEGHMLVNEPTLDNEALVEPYILGELASRYRIKHVVYDPAKFLSEARHLEQAGLIVAPLYPQGKRMREAETEFWRSAKDGKVVHDGDRVLKAHVEATGGKRTTDGHWHITKLFGRSRPIDACIAAVMAHWAEVVLEDEVPAEPWAAVW